MILPYLFSGRFGLPAHNITIKKQLHINVIYPRTALAPDVRVFRFSSKINYGTSILIARHFVRSKSTRSVTIHTDLTQACFFCFV